MKKELIQLAELGDEDIETASYESGIDFSIQFATSIIGMVVWSRDRTRAIYPLGYIGV